MGVYPDLGDLRIRTASPYPWATWRYLQPTVVTSFHLPIVANISPLDPFEILFSTGVFMVRGKTPIPDSDLRLSRALVLEMETTRDGIVLRSGFVDEDSFGATLEEAYADFLTSLRDRYRSLERRSGSLSTSDRTILERLQGILESSQR